MSKRECRVNEICIIIPELFEKENDIRLLEDLQANLTDTMFCYFLEHNMGGYGKNNHVTPAKRLKKYDDMVFVVLHLNSFNDVAEILNRLSYIVDHDTTGAKYDPRVDDLNMHIIMPHMNPIRNYNTSDVGRSIIINSIISTIVNMYADIVYYLYSINNIDILYQNIKSSSILLKEEVAKRIEKEDEILRNDKSPSKDTYIIFTYLYKCIPNQLEAQKDIIRKSINNISNKDLANISYVDKGDFDNDQAMINEIERLYKTGNYDYVICYYDIDIIKRLIMDLIPINVVLYYINDYMTFGGMLKSLYETEIAKLFSELHEIQVETTSINLALFHIVDGNPLEDLLIPKLEFETKNSYNIIGDLSTGLATLKDTLFQ